MWYQGYIDKCMKTERTWEKKVFNMWDAKINLFISILSLTLKKTVFQRLHALPLCFTHKPLFLLKG